MATNFMSGVSAGVHQGLADLVISKRANRAEKREQRRYENELMLRLGQAKSDRNYRNKMFAYQQARDKVGDEQWAQTHGLRVDMFESDTAHKEATLAETIRTHKAAEEDRDLARTQDQEQFDANLAESIRSRTSRDELSRLGILESSRQSREALTQRKQEHIDSVKDQNLARQLQSQQQQTQADYYDNIIRLREQELNRPLTELERREIEADIQLKESQAGWYDRRTSEGGSTRSVMPTWGQLGDHTGTMAAEYAKRFADRGRSFTFNPWGTVVKPGLQWKLPLSQSTPFHYDEASGGQKGQPTQVTEMQAMGADAFNRLFRETGDPDLALKRLDTLYDAILADEDFGSSVSGYMDKYGPSNAAEELRRYFLMGGLQARDTLTQGRPSTNTSPSEQIQLPERF